MRGERTNRVQQALLEFFYGVRKIEAVRREAVGDEAQQEHCARILEFGLRRTEEVLRAEGLLFDTAAASPAPGEYLH